LRIDELYRNLNDKKNGLLETKNCLNRLYFIKIEYFETETLNYIYQITFIKKIIQWIDINEISNNENLNLYFRLKNSENFVKIIKNISALE
jgi:hypothetical protein